MFCFACGCHSFINERILSLADQRQVPEKCVIGQKAKKRGYFNEPGWGIYWGPGSIKQRPSFVLNNEIPAATSLSIWLMCWGRFPLTCLQAANQKFSQQHASLHIETLPAHHADVRTCTHSPFFPSVFRGTHTCHFHTAFWMCWLGDFLKKRWITRSGCNNSALHPLLLGFYLSSLLIARHRLLVLQESYASLSYFIIREMYRLFYESLLTSHSLSQQSMSCNTTCEILCCSQRMSSLWTWSGFLL